MKTKLLLLHGALGSNKQFARIKPILDTEFDLYDMNFEGHGGRDSHQPFSIQLFTDNVIEFLQAQQLSNINIFGYSMGGYVALNLARQHPSLVGKIITLGTKFDWNPASAAQEVKMLNPEKIELKVPRFAEKLNAEHAPLDWKDVVRKTETMMTEMGAGAIIKQEAFEQIKNEVIIGLGENDRMVSKEESEMVAQKLPHGSMVQLQNVPHPIDKIEPQVLAGFIREHLY